MSKIGYPSHKNMKKVKFKKIEIISSLLTN